MDLHCQIFKKFSYETRISSREFCQNLSEYEYFKQLEDRKKDAIQDVLDSLIVNIETVDVKDGECIDKFIDDNSKYVKDNWDILSKQIPKFDDKLLMYLNLKMNLASSPVKKKAFEVVIDIEKNK